MTNANNTKKFELIFVGTAGMTLPRYKRFHDTLDSARETATNMRDKMFARFPGAASHQPVIYGPGCGNSGRTVAW